MLFSDTKEQRSNEIKIEDIKVHGFFILQSDITPNTEPIHFELGEPKYANIEINQIITNSKTNGKFNKYRPKPLF